MEKDFIGTGRRKTAVSSVRLRKGTGNWIVNGKKLDQYFFSDFYRKEMQDPLQKAEVSNNFDILVNVKGGGIHAQSQATQLAIARALVKANEGLHKLFKELGYLTRDSRKKERKKYGLAGARKKFQFSKR